MKWFDGAGRNEHADTADRLAFHHATDRLVSAKQMRFDNQGGSTDRLSS